MSSHDGTKTGLAGRLLLASSCDVVVLLTSPLSGACVRNSEVNKLRVVEEDGCWCLVLTVVVELGGSASGVGMESRATATHKQSTCERRALDQ